MHDVKSAPIKTQNHSIRYIIMNSSLYVSRRCDRSIQKYHTRRNVEPQYHVDCLFTPNHSKFHDKILRVTWTWNWRRKKWQYLFCEPNVFAVWTNRRFERRFADRFEYRLNCGTECVFAQQPYRYAGHVG